MLFFQCHWNLMKCDKGEKKEKQDNLSVRLHSELSRVEISRKHYIISFFLSGRFLLHQTKNTHLCIDFVLTVFDLIEIVHRRITYYSKLHKKCIWLFSILHTIHFHIKTLEWTVNRFETLDITAFLDNELLFDELIQLWREKKIKT